MSSLGAETSPTELNVNALFSPAVTPDSFLYTVEPGDSLYKIAKKYNTTIELIQKSNHLESDLIQSGMKLKISKAVYSITVDKSENQLSLYSDGERLKTYPVATGKPDHDTPTGSFTIVNKLTNPTWYKAGAVVSPDSPDNILGTRWLGFSLSGYGIHGTTLPETIGTAASEGCIRMFNQDVEELYAIVPLNTTVTVVE
ncbi:MAG: L,D-transpeptidase family protein [Candidatus Omnitrophica bacterium]|nr:L,D-transpeptidase family protein [Candidatus Omnitrophota bacterium]